MRWSVSNVYNRKNMDSGELSTLKYRIKELEKK